MRSTLMPRLIQGAALAALVIGMGAAAPALAETVAITNAHIYTSGPAGEIQSGTVVMRDGKITAVGANVSAPAGARVIDAHGGVVTAGLIASDSGLGAVEVGALGDDLTVKGADIGAAFDVSYGIDPDSTPIPVARMGGITGAIVTPVPSGSGFGDRDERFDDTAGGPANPGVAKSMFAGQAAVIHLDYASKDLVVRTKVAQVAPFGGLGAKVAGGARGAQFVQLKETLDDVRWYAKNRAAYDRAQTRDLHLSRADLEALIPMVEGRQPLLISVDRASDIRQALKFAREQHLKIIIDGGAEGWRVADEIAAAHVPVIVYPLQDLPGDFENLGSTLENAGRLSNAGVVVIIKSAEGGSHRVRETRYDAGNAVAHGMKWQAALDAITINPARAFGVGDSMGSLEPGKSADLVLWSGDPFEPLTQPIAVFIEGHEQPLTSRQIELQKRYHDLSNPYPPQYRQ
jgi:imidazolonepropionase-like amidohydrolase